MQSVAALNPSSCSYTSTSHRTIEPSCSSTLLTFPHSLKNLGFNRTGISFRGISIPHRSRKVVKAVATPDSALELPLTAENVESVLDEVRPYLMADGGNVVLHEIDGNVVRLKLQGPWRNKAVPNRNWGGDLKLVAIDEPIVKVRITGPAAGVMTVRVAVTQKLREKIPAIAAVQLL
ncbi:hypothetical protein IFM89_009874 [Coptis chinensis]|uniref:NIF system FeS cluster assembly NifU C-terminal domain-containing protein n=1 Tax=Coptis chinensis TaxID=261450 RepID=A0A835I1X0_9MAGN|nr:hypothetical protein IFM89_009874 [Coptis chinensis]